MLYRVDSLQEKGLVRQQLDSFDEFIQNTMQEIVDDSPDIVVSPEKQHVPGQEMEMGKTEYRIHFGQIYLSKPMMTEADGETSTLLPKEARLRNLTYSAPLYFDIPKTYTEFPLEEDGLPQVETEELSKVFIGKVPIMLR